MQAKIIKTDQDHATALARIAELMAAQPGTPESDELDLLVTLVERYEEQSCPIAPPDPVSAIRFRMEQLDLTPRDLIPYLGSAKQVREVLAGQRALTLPMIRRLLAGLRIPAESLLAPRPRARRGPRALAQG